MPRYPVIDAHLHVWDPSRAEYVWLSDQPNALRRRINIDEVIPELRKAGVDRAVLVQAADNHADTVLMLETADTHLDVAGVVAWAPLDRPADAAAYIRDFSVDPRVFGLRSLIHDLPDADWLLRPAVDTSLSALEESGLTLDIPAVLPRHLEVVTILASRHPGLRLVIDHLAKPPIGPFTPSTWRELIARAAEAPNVFVKVSGLYSAANPSAWSVDLVRPHFRHALGRFGADRMMYGSDWPVSLLAGGYAHVWNGLAQLIDELSFADREQIYGATAMSFYGIDAVEAAPREVVSQ